MDCARDVGIYKQANNIPVFNEGRENEILDAVEDARMAQDSIGGTIECCVTGIDAGYGLSLIHI